jgi:hypothetical protein
MLHLFALAALIVSGPDQQSGRMAAAQAEVAKLSKEMRQTIRLQPRLAAEILFVRRGSASPQEELNEVGCPI